MANPFTLIIAGVTGAGTGGDLLKLPTPASVTTPYVDLGSLSLTMSGDGKGGSMSFNVIQVRTPSSGSSPWWKSGTVYDNARVQFFDSRYSATTPLFLGYITGIDAGLLENGLGTRASVSVTDADGWLQKTLIRSGKTGITSSSFVDSFTLGVGAVGDSTASTDQYIINKLLERVAGQVTDASTLQLLNTAIISGSNRAIYTGSAKKIGKQTFKASTLQSALDQVAELAGGTAEVQYRYFIDNNGRLNYGPVTSAPTFASAPAEIVTDPASAQVGSTTTPTRLLSRDLSVNLDHDRIVKGIFVQTDSNKAAWDSNTGTSSKPTNDPYYRTYDGTYYVGKVALVSRTATSALVITEFAHGFVAGKQVTVELTSGPTGYAALNGTWTLVTASTNVLTFITGTSGTITYGSAVGTAKAQGSGTSRTGAGQATRNGPLPLEIFSAPKIANKGDRGETISALTRATMVSRSQPVRTVSFTIAGGNLSQTSSPDWEYGYSQGYALDAAVSLAARSGTTATITTSSDHAVAVGDSVTIALSSGPTGYTALNGTWTVTAVPSSTTFTFTTVTTGTITSGAAVGTIYRLVKAWLPGTYVKVTAAALDMSAVILYIPSITMRFAEGGGTYQVQYDIQADFRRKYLKGLGVLIGGE